MKIKIPKKTLADLVQLFVHFTGAPERSIPALSGTRTAFSGPPEPGALSSHGQNTVNASSISYPTLPASDPRIPTPSFTHGNGEQGLTDATSDGELNQHILSKRSLNANNASDNSTTAGSGSTDRYSWENSVPEQHRKYLGATESQLRESFRESILSNLRGDANTDPESIFHDMLNVRGWANENVHALEATLNPLRSAWNSTRNAATRLGMTHQGLRDPINYAAAIWFERSFPPHSRPLIGPESPSDEVLLDAAKRVSEDISKENQRLDDIRQFYSKPKSIRGIPGQDFSLGNVQDLTNRGIVTFNSLLEALSFSPRGVVEKYPNPEYFYRPSMNSFIEPADDFLYRVEYPENPLNPRASIQEIQYAEKRLFFFTTKKPLMLGRTHYSLDGGDSWLEYGNDLITSDRQEKLKLDALNKIMADARANVPEYGLGLERGKRALADDTPQASLSVPSEAGTMANRFPLTPSSSRQDDAAQMVTDQGQGQANSRLNSLPNFPDVKDGQEMQPLVLQVPPTNSPNDVQEPGRNPSISLQDPSQNSPGPTPLQPSNEEPVPAAPIMPGPQYAAPQVGNIESQQTAAPSQTNGPPTPGLISPAVPDVDAQRTRVPLR